MLSVESSPFSFWSSLFDKAIIAWISSSEDGMLLSGVTSPKLFDGSFIELGPGTLIKQSFSSILFSLSYDSATVCFPLVKYSLEALPINILERQK